MSSFANKPTLTDLARKYGADKYFRHSYMPVYERLLAHLKPHRLLEIGVGYESLMSPFVPFYVHGSSLHMWSDYWPDAHIYACDIREDALVNEGNIKSWVADQSKPMDMERLIANCGGKCDVIIDDASHQLADQQACARVLLPWVMPHGGLYIVEDVYEDTGKVLVDEFGGELIVGTRTPDDCMVVVRR